MKCKELVGFFKAYIDIFKVCIQSFSSSAIRYREIEQTEPILNFQVPAERVILLKCGSYFFPNDPLTSFFISLENPSCSKGTLN